MERFNGGGLEAPSVFAARLRSVSVRKVGWGRLEEDGLLPDPPLDDVLCLYASGGDPDGILKGGVDELLGRLGISGISMVLSSDLEWFSIEVTEALLSVGRDSDVARTSRSSEPSLTSSPSWTAVPLEPRDPLLLAPGDGRFPGAVCTCLALK